MIGLASIRTAIVVSRHRSFRSAAQELGVALSALSRRVKGLEDELGVSLFERSTAGVRQTLAGKTFITRAKSAVADLDYAIEQAAAAGRGSEGAIRIGVFGSLASRVLATLITDFQSDHPNVDIDLWEASAGAQIERLRQGRLDVAFVPGAAPIADCDSILVFSETPYMALPSGHRLADRPEISWSDLQEDTLIVRVQHPGPELQEYATRRLTDSGQKLKTLRFDVSRENLIHMVGMGFGIALASAATSSISYPNVVFRPLVESERLPVSAMWSARNDNPSLRRFLSSVRKVASDR